MIFFCQTYFIIIQTWDLWVAHSNATAGPQINVIVASSKSLMLSLTYLTFAGKKFTIVSKFYGLRKTLMKCKVLCVHEKMQTINTKFNTLAIIKILSCRLILTVACKGMDCVKDVETYKLLHILG